MINLFVGVLVASYLYLTLFTIFELVNKQWQIGLCCLFAWLVLFITFFISGNGENPDDIYP